MFAWAGVLASHCDHVDVIFSIGSIDKGEKKRFICPWNRDVFPVSCAVMKVAEAVNTLFVELTVCEV